eukprot:GHVU01128183.1.p1 GENE.GHVU01128183.1~~GHVU01128183.1.p1  ORF type:complete len:283 (-),score=48.76 GHVU01128183.1:34-882(-)
MINHLAACPHYLRYCQNRGLPLPSAETQDGEDEEEEQQAAAVPQPVGGGVNSRAVAAADVAGRTSGARSVGRLYVASPASSSSVGASTVGGSGNSGAVAAAEAALPGFSEMTEQRIRQRRQFIQQIAPFLDRPLTEEESVTFQQLALECMAANNLPFTFFERPTTHRLPSFLRPAIRNSIPSAKVLSRPLLVRRADAEKEAMVKEVGEQVRQKKALTMKSDSWERISGDHVLGVLVSCGPVVFLHEHAIGNEPGNVQRGDSFDGMATAKELEAAIGSVATVC